jgi:RNA-directed DNA polymerase
MNKGWRHGSSTSMTGFIGERTGRSHHDEPTCGNQTVDKGRWELRLWKIKSCNKLWQRFSNRFTRRIFSGSRMVFAQGVERRSPRWLRGALDALSAGIVMKKVNWIPDADIKGFFDNISHERLMELVELRIADPRILRLIGKWLKAGVSEDGQWSETKVGTPQGAVISPLLANIYLHYVLDQWVMNWRQESAKGDVIIVR